MDVPLTRSEPALKGAALAAKVQVGDFIAVELDDVQVPWILCQVLQTRHEYLGEDTDGWMGRLKKHDTILFCRRLEPTRPGSFMYNLTDLDTHVWDCDVRKVVKLAPVETRPSSRSSCPVKRFTLHAEEKVVIDGLCAATELH